MANLGLVSLFQDYSACNMKYFVFTLIVSMLGFFSYSSEFEIENSDKVWDILIKLGEDPSAVTPKKMVSGANAFIGQDIVTQGFSKQPGMEKSKRQSKHFVCTSCHNIEREDPDLTVSDPQSKLEYSDKKGLPYLQGSPLYGVSNREYYYNGDYEKKYGDLVKPARNDIRAAIQLCATECAQGRELKDWEMESIVAYLWEIQLTMGDLSLTEGEKKYIANAVSDSLSWGNAVAILRSKFLSYSPATFLAPPEDRKKGTGLLGKPENGKLIYENSCLHCHYQKRYSFLHLDDSEMSFKHLNKKIDTYDRHSIYQVVRYGTYSKNWKQSYMPQYTEEKMSNQMLADLRAYIEMRANS
jgi:mono/diheme cytochrome c family protein